MKKWEHRGLITRTITECTYDVELFDRSVKDRHGANRITEVVYGSAMDEVKATEYFRKLFKSQPDIVILFAELKNSETYLVGITPENMIKYGEILNKEEK